MIDNIKIFATEKQRLENHIVNNGVIQLVSPFNIETGEIMEYPKRGKDFNLDISLTKQSSYIKGSLHKYHNIRNDKGDQNYDDFSYSDIENEINSLLIKYELGDSNYLTNLEFGLNIVVSKDPQLIIDNNVLMNNCKAPNKNLKFSGRGDYKEFHTDSHWIKTYNKSKPFKLDSNILRLELKIIKKAYLNKLGVFKIEDLLNKNTLRRLYFDLKSKIECLVVVDEFDGKIIPLRHLNRLNEYMNPNYWIRLKSSKTSNQIYKLKKDFKLLLDKYQLLETKKEILLKMEIKFLELLLASGSKKVA
ncbi:MAG: hypothetical protein RL542_1656 [Bacteroidota bacterium]|jgi:hypothetical protein